MAAKKGEKMVNRGSSKEFNTIPAQLDFSTHEPKSILSNGKNSSPQI